MLAPKVSFIAQKTISQTWKQNFRWWYDSMTPGWTMCTTRWRANLDKVQLGVCFLGLLEGKVLTGKYIMILLLIESLTPPWSRVSILVNCMNSFRPLGDYWASSSGSATHAPESVCLFIRCLEYSKRRTEFWVQAQWWALGKCYRRTSKNGSLLTWILLDLDKM